MRADTKDGLSSYTFYHHHGIPWCLFCYLVIYSILTLLCSYDVYSLLLLGCIYSHVTSGEIVMGGSISYMGRYRMC